MSVRTSRLAWLMAAVAVAVLSLWPALCAAWCPSGCSASAESCCGPVACCCAVSDSCTPDLADDPSPDDPVPADDAPAGCVCSCECPREAQWPGSERAQRPLFEVANVHAEPARVVLLAATPTPHFNVRCSRPPPQGSPARSRLCVWVI